MSIVQGTLPVGSLDHAITLNVQSSGGSHFETMTDTTPYLHRASPQDVASSMKLKKVVGGTIAWNQRNPNPKFELGTTGYQGIGGTFTVTDGVAQVVINTALQYAYSCRIQRGVSASIKDHKYLLSAEATLSVNGKVRAYIGQMSGTPVQADVIANQYAELNTIYNCTTTNNGAISVSTGDDFAQRSIGDILYARKMCVYDLTQMFGSTIADYIYSLEQAHAGDGVAWFKALFGEDYYPYNSGELMSVKTSAHKTVGFNQWDEVWELGDINATTGQNEPNDTLIRSKNYTPVLPNTVYYFLCVSGQTGINWRSRFYDANKNYIGTGGTLLYNATFTTPSNAYYCRFTMQQSYGTTYKHDICINLSSSRNGEYEPYEEHTYALDDNLTLRGIPKLDGNNELYYDGDTYASDGTVTRKYKEVTLNGDSTYTYQLNGQTASANNCYINFGDKAYGKNNFASNRFVIAGGADVSAGTMVGRANLSGVEFRLPTTVEYTQEAYKAWFASNPTTVVYELATPTTESADAYTQAQRVGATEEFVDGRTVEIPVGNVSEYKRLIQED